jgi:O-antigen ligase
VRIGYPTEQSASVAVVLLLVAIAWGALAFGAVYPWAYWPLAATCFVTGAIGIAADRPGIAPGSRALLVALSVLGAAIALQLMPLPDDVLATISPNATRLLKGLNPAFAAGLEPRHALSVWPRDTVTALSLYVALVVLCLGAASLFSMFGPQRFAEALAGFGALLALIGIVQKSLSNRYLYGFWDIGPWRTPFGPFVNKNHFAGWMVMALPLTLALLVAGIDQGMRGVKAGWRHKVLWFASEEASRLILLAGGAALIAVALMLTMSRSGITAFVLSTLVTAWFVARTVKSRARRLAAAAALGILLLVAVVWTGPSVLASHFAAADWGEFNNRKGAWIDGWTVVRDFPIVGTGLNTYWAASLFYQQHELASFFAQAHNDYLQLAAEGGLLLTLPALACLLIFVRDVRQAMRQENGNTARWIRAGAVTSLIAVAFQETVEFSLQMPGNAVLFAVICALALHRPRPAAVGAGKPAPAHPRHAGRTLLRVVRGARRDG